LHCAEPLFSKKLIDFGLLVPLTTIGSLPFLLLKFAPNFASGLVTLKKSLFDKLLSPIIFISDFE